jgi:hypothetical protein
MAISGNIPLAHAVRWLVGLAPRGVIEFVPKSDPMVQALLALREDIFPDYAEDTFSEALRSGARITRSETISATGRKLFWYERS